MRSSSSPSSSLPALAARVALCVAFLAACAPVSAQETAAKKPPETAAAPARRLPADSVTKHSVEIDGRALAVTATAGAFEARDDKGVAQAEYAYVAYTLDGADASRPVAFVINGGPGAGSAWLQLGAIGPWRLDMAGLAPSAPPRLTPNAESWLPFADLVFLDPPGTGYARVVGDDKARKRFWSVRGDIDGLAAVIRRWLVANGRLGARKFIAGESYGGFRAPRLAEKLATDEGVGVSGLLLISPIFDLTGYFERASDPMFYLTRLPSFAAAARGRDKPVGEADLRDAEDYATGPYLADFLKGPRDAAALARMTAKVAELTGLDPAVVRRYGGRVSKDAFLEETGRAQRKVASYFDAATLSYDPKPFAFQRAFLDPIADGYVAPLTSAIEELYTTKLGWKIEDKYELLHTAVSAAWDWGGGVEPPECMTALADVLALDPTLTVRVFHGASDVQTPYLASKLKLAQLPDFGAAGRVTLQVFPGGHMFYQHAAARRALRDAARAMIEKR